jgi:hypothetical protein
MLVHGRNIIIYEGGVAIAAAKSCEIRIQCDAEEISSPSDGEWRDFIVGRKSWSVRISMLVTNVREILIHCGSRVRLTAGVRDVDNTLTADRLTGYALCTEAVVTGTEGNLAQGSWNFIGCGPLERLTEYLRDSDQKNLRDVELKDLRALDNDLT